MNMTTKFLVAAVFVGSVASASAVTVTVDPAASWQGYMNVSELNGTFLWGSGWGTVDLTATWAGPVLTLGTNNIGDPADYWYIGGGKPGAQGNKIMDANMYVETTGVYTGQTLTFTGNVISNTLFGKEDSLRNVWTSVAFIKEFAADYSSFVQTTISLNPGTFSISLNLSGDPGAHVQYGFETVGTCVWATDAASFGYIETQAVPEPTTMLAIGAGLAILARRRRTSK